MAGALVELPTTQEILESTARIVDDNRDDPGALIPVLQRLQQEFGYLPVEALQEVSRLLSIPYSEVAGVVTFYSLFSTVPRGLHTVRVCLGTACYVRGGKETVSAVASELKIDTSETTEDRAFTLEIGRCFGACGLAPVLMVDDVVHQRVTPACVPEILRRYRDGIGETGEVQS
jgi:NADH:ubiquinone oxidoreductase subunit E